MSGEKIFVEVLRVFLHIGFHSFRRVRIYNRKAVPKDGALLVLPNHQGMVDMFLVGYGIPNVVHWMAKKELFNNKLFAAIIKGLGAYPVNRGATDTSAAKHTFQLLKDEKTVGIFPQGTRAREGKPIPKAHSGAIKYAVETDTTVVPVAIWGKNRIFGKMHVRYGDPFKFPQPSQGEKYTNEEYNAMAAKLMDDIYAMRYTDKEKKLLDGDTKS